MKSQKLKLQFLAFDFLLFLIDRTKIISVIPKMVVTKVI